MKSTLTVLFVVASGCASGSSDSEPQTQAQDAVQAIASCSILSDGQGNATVSCPDGSSAVLRSGKDGRDGVDGVDGTNGADGANGVDGAQGIKGDKGDRGDTGATGAVGATGAEGAAGQTGATGATGDQGLKGDKGDKGDRGDTGLTGASGDQGTPGLTGPPGADGGSCTIGDTPYGWQVFSCPDGTEAIVPLTGGGVLEGDVSLGNVSDQFYASGYTAFAGRLVITNVWNVLLPNLQQIQGQAPSSGPGLYAYWRSTLKSINLPALTTINGSVQIDGNVNLEDLRLDALTNVTGDFLVKNNPNLPRCKVTNIVNRITVTGVIDVSGNGSTDPTLCD